MADWKHKTNSKSSCCAGSYSYHNDIQEHRNRNLASYNAKPVRNSNAKEWSAGIGKPIFNLDASDMYVKLLNFQLEVMNILETRAYDINDEERILVIKNWWGQEGLLLMETSMQEEKKNHKGIALSAKQSIQVMLYLYHTCITIPKTV